MRFIKICLVLSKYLLFHKLTNLRNKILGERLRLAFGELGLTFIKIGQILSMRYDLLSQKDCEALQKLLDNVNPIAFGDIEDIIEKEYGKKWNNVFADVYKKPLGSASVSQVHEGKLFDGTRVAIKIKRPGVDNKFSEDIKIMKKIASFASFLSPTLYNIQVKELVNHFENWLKQDLDFVLEVRNMRKLQEQYSFTKNNFRNDLGIGVFPAPFENLCTKNIIVMEYVDGIPMSKKEEILNNPDYDVKKSLKTYINAAIHNWFRDDIQNYFFQADPHLSNVIALPHGGAANIDCGLVCSLSKKDVTICKNLVIAVYMKDIKKTIDVVVELTGIDPEKYMPTIQSDFEKYLEKSQKESFGFWFIEFAKILIKYKIKFPMFLVIFGRTNLLFDGLVNTYIPDHTTLDMVGEELKRQAIKEMIDDITKINWLKMAYFASQKIKQAPEIITNFINNPINTISEMISAIKNT